MKLTQWGVPMGAPHFFNFKKVRVHYLYFPVNIYDKSIYS